MARGRGVLAFALWAVLGCGHDPVPVELIGHWTSDDPRYTGRSLQIAAEQITFGLEGAIGIPYVLHGVERETDPATGDLYRLVYAGSGEPERELRVRIPTPGHLRIENHSELWTRAAAPSDGG